MHEMFAARKRCRSSEKAGIQPLFTMWQRLPSPEMLQVSKVLTQGHGRAAVLLRRAAAVEVDWDVRQKSRFDCTDSQGCHLGVFLPGGTPVRGGDVLVAEDGSLIRVVAAPQAAEAQLDALQPIQDEHLRSMRPSSLRATARPFWRGYLPSLRNISEAVTMPCTCVLSSIV